MNPSTELSPDLDLTSPLPPHSGLGACETGCSRLPARPLPVSQAVHTRSIITGLYKYGPEPGRPVSLIEARRVKSRLEVNGAERRTQTAIAEESATRQQKPISSDSKFTRDSRKRTE
ncbi:hypothetical protein BaRGS_00030474, partial [Batillaria attramentaria]